MPRFLLFGILLVCLAGCGGGKRSGAEALAQSFGQAMMKGEWERAYGMTSSHWQKKRSEAGMKALYESVVADVEKSSGKPFKPQEISAKTESLPKDTMDAREKFGITTDAPQKIWKDWVTVELRDPASKATAKLSMLFVEEGGLKVGFVSFRAG